MENNRSIPTCVGKTVGTLEAADLSKVHPHVCGENTSQLPIYKQVLGPSPRVWGKLRMRI